MASLRFTFDGDRRPERERIYPSPFPPRYYGPLGFPRYIPPYQNVNMQETAGPTPAAAEKQEEEKINPAVGAQPQCLGDNADKQFTAIVQPIPGPAEQEAPAVSVSEQLVARLDTYETGLIKVRGHVDKSRALFDDVLYKIESFLQILEVLRANEERRLQGPQAAIASLKTDKDTIDEFLELLQTPAVQSVLRQFLVGVLVKK